MKISVGIDSVDSQYGGCTTHLLYRLFRRLVEKDYVRDLLDYPYLVRLNPSIPHKTRGNGAVAISLELKDGRFLDHLVDELVDLIVEYASYIRGDLSKACAVLVPNNLSGRLYEVYAKALTDFVHLDYIKNLVSLLGDKVVLPLGLNKGCVGALAALGWDRSRCSYELLVYRRFPSAEAGERTVDTKALAELDRMREFETFCSYDYKDGRAISVPRGPDPVLVGIRGLDPDRLVKAFSVLRLGEPVEGWIVFKTNQATGAHMVARPSIELKPFRTGCLAGLVKNVSIRPGGDVLLGITDGFGEMEVAVFKETGLTKYARQLKVGDIVRVCGSVKLWENSVPVLHAELIEVIEVEETLARLSPRCPRCGARMKSAGRGKGYKCVRCGLKARDLPPEVVEIPRDIATGVYLPGCGSVKHLSIPISLYSTTLECREKVPGVVSDFYARS